MPPKLFPFNSFELSEWHIYDRLMTRINLAKRYVQKPNIASLLPKFRKPDPTENK